MKGKRDNSNNARSESKAGHNVNRREKKKT